MGLRETITGAFSFFATSSRAEERVATYVMREHHRGRPLDAILDDAYVKNRCTEEQIKRLLDRPEVIHAIGEDTIAATRSGS
jgi:hypothetical protein